MGQRVVKEIVGATTSDYEIYSYDAGGNVMTIYSLKYVSNKYEMRLAEVPIYGSDRLGEYKPNVLLTNCATCAAVTGITNVAAMGVLTILAIIPQNGLDGKNIICTYMNFNNLIWHDAILKKIEIPRNNPGNEDIIVFEVQWPDNTYVSKLVFEDVYWASFNMNFGIIAEETILEANEITNQVDNDLSNLRFKWKGHIDHKKLSLFTFKLNSSTSEIKIIANSISDFKYKAFLL